MATSTIRPRISTETIPSLNVNAHAIRLVLAGYLAKLRFNVEEDNHVYFDIPSETRKGVVYQIDYCRVDHTLACSCPAGQHGKSCKHMRLFQLQIGAGIVEVSS